MKALICGGRDYRDKEAFRAALDRIEVEHGAINLVINGGALGADLLARIWAQEQGIPYATVDADWRRHGKAAGPIRNAAMLALAPDVVIAFPGGPGTADMVRKAKAAMVKVIEVPA